MTIQRLSFLLITLFVIVSCYAAQVNKYLIADFNKSYILETEVSLIVTIHGDNWVMHAGSAWNKNLMEMMLFLSRNVLAAILL